MRVLVACEFSGVVRRAFCARGHDSWSCDTLPSDDNSDRHIQDDVLKHLNGWDLIIAHPPCTYFTNAGARWFYDARYKDRANHREAALSFVKSIASADCDKIAIENPVGTLSTLYRKPDQIIQPWQFGHDASKATCLWLKNLPKLIPTKLVDVSYIETKNGRKFTKWFFESSCLPLSKRSSFRSKTFEGIGEAMAEQWGSLSAS